MDPSYRGALDPSYRGVMNSSQTVSIGLDLGGTNFSVGVLAASKTLEFVTNHETRSFRPRDEIVHDLAAAISSVATKAKEVGWVISGVGVGFPGVIEPWAGTVLLPPNFSEGWHGFALARALQEATGLETFLINDARAFTFAEARLGAGRGSQHMLGVTLGTGVGGGLVLDGQLYLGAFGTAGEFGHQIVDRDGLDCGCGQRGCIETISSGPSIVAAAVRPFLQGRAPKLREIVGGKLEHVTPKTVADAARDGDADCLEIIDRAAIALAHGITNVSALLGLETVVIGGGVAGAGGVLFDPIRTHLKRMLRVTEHTPDVVQALLEHPGVIGAAVWASEQARGAA
jgi:glucokinase